MTANKETNTHYQSSLSLPAHRLLEQLVHIREGSKVAEGHIRLIEGRYEDDPPSSPQLSLLILSPSPPVK